MTTARFRFKMTPDGRFTDVEEIGMTKLEQVALALFDCTAEQWARKSANFREAAMKDVRRLVEALRDQQFGELGLNITDEDGHTGLAVFDACEVKAVWQHLLDAILSEKDRGQISADMLDTGSCGFGQAE